MQKEKIELLDQINEIKEKLFYLGAVEDKPGLSNILIDIGTEVEMLAHLKYFRKEGDENVTES